VTAFPDVGGLTIVDVMRWELKAVTRNLAENPVEHSWIWAGIRTCV
jgi:hypothetical protein